MKDPLAFLQVLKSIPRSGWLQAGVSLEGVESVSEHSFDTVSLTMVFCDILRSKGRKLDHEQAIRAAMVHDWAECLMMDLPRSAKKFLEDPGSAKRAEKKAFESLVKELPVPKEGYLKAWELAHSNSDEGNLVKLADLYSMYLQAERYRISGNKDAHIKQIRDFAKAGIKKRLKLFPELKPLLRL